MILSLYLSLTGLLRNHEKMVCDCDLIFLSGQLKLSRRTMEAQPWWELSAWACSRLRSWELSTCSTSSPGWRGSKTGWSRSSSPSHHPLPHHLGFKVSSTWGGAAWRPPRRKSLPRCQEGSFWGQFLLETTARCQEWSPSRLWGSSRSAEALWREWRPRRWPTSSSWSSSSQAPRSRLHRQLSR